MNISGTYIPSELVNRTGRSQQSVGTSPSTQKVRQSSPPLSTEQQKSAAIIDAEFVDLHHPIPRRPPEHSQHWRTLFVESDEQMATNTPISFESNTRQQQMIARYSDHSSDISLPGSHFSLMA